jgi:tetratricopeptide (TPR) repeat protein
VEAKGFAAPVAAYEMLRPLPRPEKVRGIEGLRASLIGRDHELEQLVAALDEVRAGRGQIACVIGEAGVGKSRLIAELKERALMGGGRGPAPSPDEAGRMPAPPRTPPLWLEGRCLDIGMTVSYWPFLDMLRAYAGFTPDDDRARGERLAAALADLVGQGHLTAVRATEMLPLLGNLLAARFGSEMDERLAHAGPEQIKQQTFLALRDVFLALAQQQPLVMVLEDLHWADSLSLDVIPLLMETLTLAPLFLVCIYRPEQEHKCWHLATIAQHKCADRCTELHLRELTAQQSRRLVESLLHIEELPGAVKAQILARAQGNPFFVEEVVRSLIDGGLVYHDGTVWRARAEIGELAVPESVQSVILSRVDRLDEEVRRVLQSAAVIGRLFQRRLLGQVTQKEAELDHALRELEDRQLIYEERAIPDEEYSFEHVLTQETVYHNILRRRRAVFHQQVAEGIERLYADSLEGYYEQLAHHYDRAGAAEKAIEYLLKAGEKARRAFLNDEALAYFQRALERLEGRESTRAHDEQRLTARQGLAHTWYALGEKERAADSFRQAIDLGRALQLPPHDLVRRYYHWLGHALIYLLDPDESFRVCAEGWRLVGDDTSLEAALMIGGMGIALWYQGNHRRALEHIHRCATLVRPLPYVGEMRSLYFFMACAPLVADKRSEESLQLVQRFQALLRQQPDDLALMGALELAAGIIRASIGDLPAAVAHAQRSADLSHRSDATDETTSLYNAATYLWSLGDLPGAEEHTARLHARLEQLYRSPTARGAAWGQAEAASLRGSLALCRGSVEEAIASLRAAHAASRASPDGPSGLGPLAAITLARAYLAQGAYAEVLPLLEEALASCCASDMAGALTSLWRVDVANALSGIEEASSTPQYVRTLVEQLRRAYPESRLVSLVPSLEPGDITRDLQAHRHAGLVAPLSPGWAWHDPFGDCSCSLDGGLLIRAANGRDMWHVNLSAPRLLQRAPADGFAVQTICGPVSDAQPAIGGLLLWQDAQHYLVLEWGHWGAADIAFRGCLENEDRLIGRGRLPGQHVWLRLERRGSTVHALCSADGRQWFRAGAAEFPAREGEQAGLHAIGSIDRTIYHGAYPEGTAIRFASFEVWTAVVS